MRTDAENASAHIAKAERSQGQMNNDQRREILEVKTDWSASRITAALQALTKH